jgi:DNA-binding XRE family transcriptional regulator
MNLKEYFVETGMRMEWFANKIGVSPATIYNICSGRQEPSLSVASIIEEQTKGAVRCMDLSHNKYRLEHRNDKKPNAKRAKPQIEHDKV